MVYLTKKIKLKIIKLGQKAFIQCDLRKKARENGAVFGLRRKQLFTASINVGWGRHLHARWHKCIDFVPKFNLVD